MLARALRKNMTGTEHQLWSRLRGRQLEGWKFRRQHPIGEYIVDFVCLAARLVVELDGYSHGVETQLEYDQARDRYLRGQGYRVLRFSGDYHEPEFIEGVVATIFRELDSMPTPGPPPARRGRALI